MFAKYKHKYNRYGIIYNSKNVIKHKYVSVGNWLYIMAHHNIGLSVISGANTSWL